MLVPTAKKRPAEVLALSVLVTASLVTTAACGGGAATRGTSFGGGATTEGLTTTPASAPTTGETTLASVPGAAPSPIDPGALGVFFPRHELSPRENPMPAAGTGGELIVDGAGCLRLGFSFDGGSKFVPLWPPGYELGAEDGEVYVLDEAGEVAARVGDEVELGGGGIGTYYGGSLTVDREGGPTEGERARQELLQRCPGDYWLVSRVNSD